MIVSLLFWGHSLDRQSSMLYNNDVYALQMTVDSTKQPEFYKKEITAIKERENSRKRQYLGEGMTFLIVILIGAGVVYTSIRNNNKLVQQQTNFILSITHELKSPIAAIKLNLETLSKRKLEEEMRLKLLGRSIAESNRLDDLCNNLLLASQMESRHFKAEDERLNFSELVTDSVVTNQSRTKHLFITEIEDNLFAYGDPLLWRLAINNLLENAIKYSPSDNAIKVSLHLDEQELCLNIADEGEGISDQEKSKVFKKFYRVGNENSRKTKGTGLGLYLTARIIDRVHGSIAVRDNEPKGTVFEVTIPAAIG